MGERLGRGQQTDKQEKGARHDTVEITDDNEKVGDHSKDANKSANAVEPLRHTQTENTKERTTRWVDDLIEVSKKHKANEMMTGDQPDQADPHQQNQEDAGKDETHRPTPMMTQEAEEENPSKKSITPDMKDTKFSGIC